MSWSGLDGNTNDAASDMMDGHGTKHNYVYVKLLSCPFSEVQSDSKSKE